ncbi:MAG: secretin and TonB N-terminal domain-containing protein, partial [Candidatus Omnitrophica bacterium]|nr:secretin and TonB N-terminal domain-containing protein [Candidatus Omnitrophota bacterium]
MTNRTIFMFLTTALVFLVLSTNPCFSLEMETFDDLLYMEPEKTISLDFTDANLNDVLKIFSQQSGLNFIAATDVASKKVNLYLNEVPVEEALERILSANNLTYELKPGSNIFVVNELKVSGKNLITRVYPLKFATVPSSKLNKTLSIETGGIAENVDPESMGILGAVSSMLTENGSVIEDTRTNSLIVSDILSQFPIIEQTIARLDVRVPQILIEAEMLDISKNTADLLGAKFGNTPMTFTGGERDHVYPWNQNQLLNKGYTFEEAEYRVGTISFAGLAVTLQFLRTMTDTKHLARPRILTLNNDTAEISISTDEAIGLASSTTASEGTS